jgi:isoleucyl-tRNA synthetase
VLRYTDEWERYVTRQARWVDFDNDYKTMDLSYMESVMWAFKQLWDKGLVYEGYRVLPYCWGARRRCRTSRPASTTLPPRQDPALTVAFELETARAARGTEILAWTTTPWTLPSNLALAVGPDIDYAVMAGDGQRATWLAEASLGALRAELAGADRRSVATLKGAELVGRYLRPLFPFFADTPNAFQVLAGRLRDHRRRHRRGAHGARLRRGRPARLRGGRHPGRRARSTTRALHRRGARLGGRERLRRQPEIIRDLKAPARRVRHETYDHNYPHCWRTDSR